LGGSDRGVKKQEHKRQNTSRKTQKKWKKTTYAPKTEARRGRRTHQGGHKKPSCQRNDRDARTP